MDDKDFTLTFGGGSAGNDVTFYINETHWNIYGVWGQVTVYINKPKLIPFPIAIRDDRGIINFVYDGKIRDLSGNWHHSYKNLYETYGTGVFNKLPDGLCFIPEKRFCYNLLFNFSYEERVKIAKVLNLRLNEENRKILFCDLNIKKAIDDYLTIDFKE